MPEFADQARGLKALGRGNGGRQKSRREQSALRRFLDSEAAGGLLLMAAAALALVVANSAFGDAYRHLLHLEIGPMLRRSSGR